MLVARFHIFMPIWLSITTHCIIPSPLIPSWKKNNKMLIANKLLVIWATSSSGWFPLNYNSETKHDIQKNCHIQVTEYIPSLPSILKCRDKLEDSHTLSKVVDLVSHLNNPVKMLSTQEKLFLRHLYLLIDIRSITSTLEACTLRRLHCFLSSRLSRLKLTSNKHIKKVVNPSNQLTPRQEL